MLTLFSVVQQFKLPDLSSRNKSLYRPKKTEGMSFFDLQKLDFLKEAAFRNHTKSDCWKKKIQLNPRGRSTLGEVNRISKLLSKNCFRDNWSKEENRRSKSFSGLAFFLEGKMRIGKILRSSLLSLPCKTWKEAQKTWSAFPTDNCNWIQLCISYCKWLQVKIVRKRCRTGSRITILIPIENFAIGAYHYWKPISHFQPSVLYFLRIELLSLSQLSEFSVDSSKFQDGKDLRSRLIALLGQFAQKRKFFIQGLWEFIDSKTTRGFGKHYFKSFSSRSGGRVPRGRQLFLSFPLDALARKMCCWNDGKGKA